MHGSRPIMLFASSCTIAICTCVLPDAHSQYSKSVPVVTTFSSMVTTFSGVVAVKTEVVVVDEGHVILVDHEEALHLCVCVMRAM
jgi:hypothetical protein